jgi:predicted DNA-binding transcriptional regulator AlpA
MATEPLRLHSPATQAPRQVAVELSPSQKRLIRLADLFAQLDVSKPTGHRLIAANKIGPKPIRLTPGTVRYDSEEVSAWLSTRRPDGNLHDARTWPAVWEAIQKKRT